MSGEGKSVSFKRTRGTTKSNEELRKEFQFVVFGSPVTKHMKFYGDRWDGYKDTVELQEHGDKELQKWQQKAVAIKDTFQFYMSFYESWSEDWKLLEDENDECSLVSLAKEFAKDNNLMFFPEGFPSEWIRQEIIDGEKHWHHFVIKPDDKNIDKICELWLNDDWNKARDKIEQIMEKKEIEHAI